MAAVISDLKVHVRLRIETGVDVEALHEIAHVDLASDVPVQVESTKDGMTLTIDREELRSRLHAAAIAFENAFAEGRGVPISTD